MRATRLAGDVSGTHEGRERDRAGTRRDLLASAQAELSGAVNRFKTGSKLAGVMGMYP